MMYDIIDKLHNLELAGSGRAKVELDKLRNCQSDKAERVAFQAFENGILELMAVPDFELISRQELFDLSRIAEDRNRCAHPSMDGGLSPFSMTAELARTHLRNAVLYLLQHPPVQGQFAKDQIFNEIRSPLFPEDPERAVQRLSHGPLGHARQILVKAVFMVVDGKAA
jgi:hypothetical protein